MQVIPTKTDGVSTLPAAEFNQIPLEISNTITASGITPSSGDAYQLSKAIANYSAVGQFYVDSGTANAKVLSVGGSRNGPTAYTTGMVIRFLNLVLNTGTVTVNVNGLGVKDLYDIEGQALSAGDLVTGAYTEAYYDGTRFRAIDTRYKVALSVSSSTTLTTAYMDRTVLVDSSGGNVTVTLPDVTICSEGSTITIIRVNAASNNYVRIACNGAQQIAGKTTVDLYGRYSSLILRRAQTAWHVVGEFSAPLVSGGYSSGSTSCANNTLTLIDLGTAGVTRGSGVGSALSTGFVDLTNDRLYGLIPGWYYAVATLDFAANATGYREIRIRKNGSTPSVSTVSSAVGSVQETLITAGYFQLNGTTDYVSLHGLQNSGGSLGAIGDMTLVYVGRDLA